jgi:hypothetical protein
MSELILTNYENINDHQFKVEHKQDISGILEANYRDRLNTDENWQKSKDMKLAARIPMAIWLQWQQLGITDNEAALKKAINLHPELKTVNKEL